jgi:hypothetical protein
MNWQRGFFRAWVLVSLCWVGYIGWNFMSACFYFSGSSSILQPLCETGIYKDGVPTAGLLSEFTFHDWLRLFRRLIAPPIVLFLIGAVTFWMARGFKKHEDWS